MNNDMLIRVTRYYRALNRLRSIGLEKVFAHNLADAAGVSAAVVRKDFSTLEIHGQKRGGYEITELIDRIGTILGKGDEQHVIVVGCGRIGKALMHYSGFENDGIRIVAGFDNDPIVYSDASQPNHNRPGGRRDGHLRRTARRRSERHHELLSRHAQAGQDEGRDHARRPQHKHRPRT